VPWPKSTPETATQRSRPGEAERHRHPPGGAAGGDEGNVRGDGVPGRQHVADRAAESVFDGDAGDCRGGRVPVQDTVLAIEQDDTVRHVGESLGGVRTALSLAVQPRVVDRYGRAVRKLRRKLEVCLGVGRLRLGGDQRQRAEGAVARRQGDADRRAQAELVPDSP
jgi:hypothetical protein